MDTLPDEILLFIFKKLQDGDLLACALTCRRWRHVTQEPALWRRRTFEFRGYSHRNKERAQSAIRGYLSAHGSALRALTVLCPKPNLISAYSTAASVGTLLSELTVSGQASLREFHMCHLNYILTWEDFRTSKSLLMTTVCNFVSKQKGLQIFNMSDNFFSVPMATNIMRNLRKSTSVRTLEKIDIVDFYYMATVQPETISYQIESLVCRCHNLKEIALNYSYINATSIEVLCENLKDSLKKMHIYLSFWEYSHFDEIVTSQEWITAKELIPKLEVSLMMSFWCVDPTIFLVKGMPLVKFDIRGGKCRYSNQSYGEKTSALLEHLARNFKSTLETASLNCNAWGSSESDSRDAHTGSVDALIDFLSSCSSLKQLDLSEDMFDFENKKLKSAIEHSRKEGKKVNVISRNTRGLRYVY